MTASIAIMPDITHAVGVPRTLIVPFGLGRPFGAPDDPAMHSQVLRALLALCPRTDVPVTEVFVG